MGGLVAAASLLSVCGSAEIALLLVASLVSSCLLFAVDPSASWTAYILMGAVCLSVPVSGSLAALLIGQAALPSNFHKWRTHIFIFAAGLSLLATDLHGFAADALQFAQNDSNGRFVLELLSIGGSVCSVAAMVAITVTVLILCVELPVQWFLHGRLEGAPLSQIALATQGMRPMLAVLILSLCFRFIVDLIVAELWP